MAGGVGGSGDADTSPNRGSVGGDDSAGSGSAPSAASANSPASTVRSSIEQVSQISRSLDQVAQQIATLGQQYPGSRQRVQAVGSMVSQLKQAVAAIMSDIVKQTSPDVERSEGGQSALLR